MKRQKTLNSHDFKNKKSLLLDNNAKTCPIQVFSITAQYCLGLDASEDSVVCLLE